MTHKLIKTDNYLLVVSDEYIKDVRPFMGRWHLEDNQTLNKFPTYLTDLSACKLIIAHLPLNGSPILEGVDLLPPYSRHQEDGIELLIPFPEYHCRDGREIKTWMDGWEEGHKEGYQIAREKYKYTEYDMKMMFEKIMKLTPHDFSNYLFDNTKILNHLLQSLHQYPTEFEKDDYQMSTLSNGQQVWVGKYK